MPVAIESASAKETFGAGEDVMGRFLPGEIEELPLLLLAFCAAFWGQASLERSQNKATLTRLELARAEPSRFLVCPLNHSGTTPYERFSRVDGLMHE